MKIANGIKWDWNSTKDIRGKRADIVWFEQIPQRVRADVVFPLWVINNQHPQIPKSVRNPTLEFSSHYVALNRQNN